MKKLLLVVDYQEDFVNGSLGFDGAELLDDKISEKINTARGEGWDIAFTLDTHTAKYSNTQEGKALPVLHCIKDTAGWRLFGRVGTLALDDDKMFYKSGYGSNEMYNYFLENPFDEIEIIGLVTNICVIFTAALAKTALPEAKIIVPADCVGSFNVDLHEKALDVMEGFNVLITDRD